jgi:lipopolysaccharide transport system permease protein
MKPMQRSGLQEFWSHRELLFFMVWRDLKVRYKQTALGVAWAVIQPLASTLIFFLLFGKMAKMPSDGVPYPVFVYLGMAVWTYFAGAVGYSSNSLVNNSQLLTKVWFPRIIIPLAGVLSLLPDFIIAALVGFAIMIAYGQPLAWTVLLWPLLMPLVVLLALGASLILATLNVRYRDVKYAVPFLMQMWMFLTPIIYPVSKVPEQYRPLLLLNPMAGTVEAFRTAALGGRALPWPALGAALGFGIIVLLLGLRYFSKAEREFADII